MTDPYHGSRHGYLILDRSEKIIHTSSHLQGVLRLKSEIRPDGTEDLISLLRRCGSISAESLSALRDTLERCSCPGIPGAVSKLMLHSDNGLSILCIHLRFLDEAYRIAELEDVTSQAEHKSSLTEMLHRDPLTGVGNRLLFEQKLDRTLEELSVLVSENVTVLFIDLDRFKIVNDTLGHAVGDALLRTVSERLQCILRTNDTLARLGGDEFAIMLEPGSGKESARTVAAQIIDMVQRPYLIEGHVINVGASVGVAMAPTDGRSRDHLLKSADLALYHSKAAGRGVFHFFDPAMEQKAQQRRSLELDLRKALPLRQFELHYQPQIDVESGRTTALEALLRWRHPVRGLLQPEQFLWLAEEIGLAVPIGKWILKTACREAMRWPDPLTVAFNVSRLQFEAGGFEKLVEQALRDSSLPGWRLEIEVTEDILLRDGQTVSNTLENLRMLGIKIVMDNFGTGLASLGQMVNFPFNKIKIDRSLVGKDHGDAKNRAIVRAISALGQSLGISTLAEGVETSEDLAQVRAEGCDSIQGFFYSRAVSASELIELFQSLPGGQDR